MNKLIYKIFTSANTRFIKYYRKNRIKNTIANTLSIGHIDSLELLELIKSKSEINVIFDICANVGSWSILANATLKAFGYHTPIGADLKQMDVLFINSSL